VCHFTVLDTSGFLLCIIAGSKGKVLAV